MDNTLSLSWQSWIKWCSLPVTLNRYLAIFLKNFNIKQKSKQQLSNLVLYTCADNLLLNVRIGGFLLKISRPGRYIFVIVGITCHFSWLILISFNLSIPNYFHLVYYLFIHLSFIFIFSISPRTVVVAAGNSEYYLKRNLT